MCILFCVFKFYTNLYHLEYFIFYNFLCKHFQDPFPTFIHVALKKNVAVVQSHSKKIHRTLYIHWLGCRRDLYKRLFITKFPESLVYHMES